MCVLMLMCIRNNEPRSAKVYLWAPTPGCVPMRYVNHTSDCVCVRCYHHLLSSREHAWLVDTGNVFDVTHASCPFSALCMWLTKPTAHIWSERDLTWSHQGGGFVNIFSAPVTMGIVSSVKIKDLTSAMVFVRGREAVTEVWGRL